MYSRRDLGRLALAALPAALGVKKIDSTVDGVRFGLQSYVFSNLGLPRDSVLDAVIASMVEAGLGECDLFGPLIAPGLDEAAFRAIRRKFEDAGVTISALSVFPGSSEAELSRTLDIAAALGAKLVTLAIPLSAAKRVAPLADRHTFRIGLLGGPNMRSSDPDAIARPAQYEQAVSFSKNYGMSFDIGDATAGGYDALRFVADHLDRVALLYIKDRRKTGESVPFGEGDTPIQQVLRLVRDRRLPIPCYIDCDHRTSNRAADVKRSFEYVKAALA